MTDGQGAGPGGGPGGQAAGQPAALGAPPHRAEDKFGTAIAPGDVVEVVYGGERHEMSVEAIARDAAGLWVVTGQVRTSAHAALTRVLPGKGTEQTGGEEDEEPEHRTPHRISHRPAARRATRRS